MTDRAKNVIHRAHSLLVVKAINEDERTIEGIASTPTVDRTGDIVEPKGAQFELPIPLLWQHNSRQPVGWVEEAKITDEGIFVRARFAKIDEEGDLKKELDRAWQSVKAKLVRGLSIGFKSIEEARINETYSYRYMKWLWLELSCVTIPANQEATITAVKAIDEQIRAASRESDPPVVRLGTSPGASGMQRKETPTITSRGSTMNKTVQEQIADFEAKRAANAGRMGAIMNKAAEETRTLKADEEQEHDTLASEIEAIDKHLARLKNHEKLMVASTAVAVTRQVGDAAELAARGERSSGLALPGSFLTSRSNLAPGVKMARFAMALIRAQGNKHAAVQVIENDAQWMKSSPELLTVMKAAVAAGDTTTSGWASELVYAENLANEFIEYLRPKTILGRIPNLRRVPFNIRVGGMSGGLTGYWVGQGQPIPVSKGTTTSVSLGIAKAAGLAAIDNELARLSTPSAELMIRDDLAAAVQFLLDDSFINPNNGGVTNVSPASITYGVTPVTPSGATYAAMRTDIQTMMEVALDANLDNEGSVWIMSSTLALRLSMMVNALDQKVNPDLSVNGGTFLGMPVIVSQAAQIAGSPQYGDVLLWVHPREIYLADDGQVAIETSREASIQMLDNPTNASTGGTTPTTVVSMFQTETLAIKAVRYVNWVKRRSTAVQWIQAAAYL